MYFLQTHSSEASRLQRDATMRNYRTVGVFKQKSAERRQCSPFKHQPTRSDVLNHQLASSRVKNDGNNCGRRCFRPNNGAGKRPSTEVRNKSRLSSKCGSGRTTVVESAPKEIKLARAKLPSVQELLVICKRRVASKRFDCSVEPGTS